MDKVAFLAAIEQRAMGKGPENPGKKTLGIRNINATSITPEELRVVVAENPDHPVAKVYAKALKKIKGNKPLVIDSPDILALLRNHTVAVNRSQAADGIHSITKEVLAVSPPVEDKKVKSFGPVKSEIPQGKEVKKDAEAKS